MISLIDNYSCDKLVNGLMQAKYCPKGIISNHRLAQNSQGQ